MGGNPLESIIGAIVLAVAVGFLSFAYSNTDIGAVDGYELTARFDQIGGLSVGSDVRISGVKVGTIVDQSLDPETFEAVVRLSIDPNIRLDEDTAVKVASEGLLGGYFLAVIPGGSDEMLGSGDEITHVAGYVDLMSLVNKFVAGSDFSSKKEQPE